MCHRRILQVWHLVRALKPLYTAVRILETMSKRNMHMHHKQNCASKGFLHMSSPFIAECATTCVSSSMCGFAAPFLPVFRTKATMQSLARSTVCFATFLFTACACRHVRVRMHAPWGGAQMIMTPLLCQYMHAQDLSWSHIQAIHWSTQHAKYGLWLEQVGFYLTCPTAWLMSACVNLEPEKCFLCMHACPPSLTTYQTAILGQEHADVAQFGSKWQSRSHFIGHAPPLLGSQLTFLHFAWQGELYSRPSDPDQARRHSRALRLHSGRLGVRQAWGV